jgi:CheY-like chemotaxis protein
LKSLDNIANKFTKLSEVQSKNNFKSDLLNNKLNTSSDEEFDSKTNFLVSNKVYEELSSKDKNILKKFKDEINPFQPADFNVFIVDDLLPNRTIARIILHENGFNYAEAENGEEALSLIEETNPDIILMDIHMPLLDGIETMLKIRSNPWKFQDIPIIALTTATQKRKDEFIGKGFTDYIQKPFREEEILDCIKKALTK